MESGTSGEPSIPSPAAFDADILDDVLSMRGEVAKAGAQSQRERDATQHKEGREQPSGQRPPHHYWCFPLEPDPRRRYGFRNQAGHCFVADF